MWSSLKGVTVVAALMLAAAGPVIAQVSVDGKINLHDGAVKDPTITPQAGASTGETIASELPPFVYTVPPVDTAYTTPIPTGVTTIVGPGAGNTHVYEYTATTLGVGDHVNIVGGGTVMIHINGDFTLDHATMVIGVGVRAIFFVSGDTEFLFANITSAGGAIQIQGRDDVLIRQPVIRAVAVANGTLTLRGDLTNIVADEGLRNKKQEGATGRLRVLPIVEGE